MSRQADYAERQKAKGLTLVKVWVPEGQDGIIKAQAKELRDQWQGPQQVNDRHLAAIRIRRR